MRDLIPAAVRARDLAGYGRATVGDCFELRKPTPPAQIVQAFGDFESIEEREIGP